MQAASSPAGRRNIHLVGRRVYGSGMFRRAQGRVAVVSQWAHAWVERQDPGSPSGVAIGAWRRYQAVDGPLQSALLSLYVLVAIIWLIPDRRIERVIARQRAE